jgi:hypothetical protein
VFLALIFVALGVLFALVVLLAFVALVVLFALVVLVALVVLDALVVVVLVDFVVVDFVVVVVPHLCAALPIVRRRLFNPSANIDEFVSPLMFVCVSGLTLCSCRSSFTSIFFSNLLFNRFV